MVTRLNYNLYFDKETDKDKYFIYRSKEQEGNRPIIDGVYIQQEELKRNPPKSMNLTLEFKENDSAILTIFD